MEMHQIRYFLSVSRHLNFTRAAEACNVAQPSLTRAIKKLEEELGGDLFRRERRATHLTDLGRMMLPMLENSYEGALSAKELAISYAKGDHAPLSVAFSHSVAMEPFLPVFAELARTFSGLDLVLTRGSTAEVLALLKSGDIEFGIAGEMAETWDRLNIWPLFVETALLYAHRDHPLADRGKIASSDIRNVCLLDRPYCDDAKRWHDCLRNSGMSPSRSFAMSDDRDVSAFLAGNLGVAFLTGAANLPDDLCAIAVEDQDLQRTVRLYDVAGRRRSVVASAFMKLVRCADLMNAVEMC